VVNFIITYICLYKSKISYYLLLLVRVNTAKLSVIQLNKGTIIWLIGTTLPSLFRVK
jgi:hypothetical protein